MKKIIAHWAIIFFTCYFSTNFKILIFTEVDMNNDNQQESENDLKTIGRIEVKHRPLSFEEERGNNVQVGYVHKVLDKLMKDLNDRFVPKLDDVLDNNNKSINQLNNALAEGKSRLDELVVKVDANYEGLVEDLKDLR
ncbi:hypothetical protein [Wolbachia endosymbiont of Mansonella perstans]|uniref:hypothetical protein n=1 Tax=Wolbachia endosymbiont of Mansonella perstans TaxID=229526 RepID=UPI001CE11D26|nr:hypothetical protein [Wolbachia endosymbiont of Mansonella perstans]